MSGDILGDSLDRLAQPLRVRAMLMKRGEEFGDACLRVSRNAFRCAERTISDGIFRLGNFAACLQRRRKVLGR